MACRSQLAEVPSSRDASDLFSGLNWQIKRCQIKSFSSQKKIRNISFLKGEKIIQYVGVLIKWHDLI